MNDFIVNLRKSGVLYTRNTWQRLTATPTIIYNCYLIGHQVNIATQLVIGNKLVIEISSKIYDSKSEL